MLEIYIFDISIFSSKATTARLAQSVERETLSLSRSNRHDYSVHLKVVGSTPTSGLYVIFFCYLVIRRTRSFFLALITIIP